MNRASQRGAGILAGAVIGIAIWFAIDATRSMTTASGVIDNVREALNTVFPGQFPPPEPPAPAARTMQAAAAIAGAGIAYYLLVEGV